MPLLTATPNAGSVATAIRTVAEGGIVVVVGGPGAPSGGAGQLVMAAEKATPETMGFFVRHTSGVICAAMTGQRLDVLDIPPMVRSGPRARPAFAVSVDFRHGTSTGISAADRAVTLRGLADPAARPEDFTRPGHMFPVRCDPHGVLARDGHAEAAVDLTRLAGLMPAGATCEILNDDGSVPRRAEIAGFAALHALPVVTVAGLLAHRLRTETLVRRVAQTTVATPFGRFHAVAYRSQIDAAQHVALVHGKPAIAVGATVRLHRACLLGDVFGSTSCACRSRLHTALRTITETGAGVLLYRTGETWAASDASALHGCGGDLPNPAVVDQILRDLGGAVNDQAFA